MNARPALQADPAGTVDPDRADSTFVRTGDAQAFTARIDRELDQLLATEVDDEWLRGAIGCQLGWSETPVESRPPARPGSAGKRIRPLLALLCFESALVVRDPSAGGHIPADGGHIPAGLDAIVTFAAGVELVHNFTLVHDDVMDRTGSGGAGRPCGSSAAGPRR